MKKNSLLCAIILGIMATTLPAQTVKKDYTHQVDSVLKLMTVEEKVGQMIQYSNNKLVLPLTVVIIRKKSNVVR